MEQRLSARKEDLNAATSRVSEMEAQLKELEKAVAEKEENLNKRKLELEVAENEALGAFDAASPGDRGLVVDIQSPGIDPPEPKGLASKSRNDDDGDYHKTSQLEEEVDGLHEMLQQKGERVGMLELEVMRHEKGPGNDLVLLAVLSNLLLPTTYKTLVECELFCTFREGFCITMV